MLVIFALAKVRENGDFIGYTNAGNLVLNQGDIYSDMFNTWPPPFSVMAVPLAIISNISFILVRILWMVFIFICFFYCIKSVIGFLSKSDYSYKILLKEILVQPFYLLALFLSCRSFMDNIIYMQINLVMLAACCWLMSRISEKTSVLASIFLGLTIGAKVYNIVLLPLAILFRKWKALFWILAGIAISVALCWLTFGIAQTNQYFHVWYYNIGSIKQSIVHRNQSLISGLIRLFSDENYEVNQFPPIANLKPSNIQFIFLGIMGAMALSYLLIFYKFLKDANRDFVYHTFILVVTVIPLIAPISWKANYIYALPAIFFIAHSLKNKEASKGVKILYTLSMLSLCLSNEALIGRPAMYFLENLNILIIGEILLFYACIVQMNDYKIKNFYSLDMSKI